MLATMVELLDALAAMAEDGGGDKLGNYEQKIGNNNHERHVITCPILGMTSMEDHGGNMR